MIPAAKTSPQATGHFRLGNGKTAQGKNCANVLGKLRGMA
jgi:hypothetical protein